MKNKEKIKDLKTTWTAEEVVAIINDVAKTKVCHSINVGGISAERYLYDITKKGLKYEKH